jgi:hypothetical protein
VKNVRRKFPDLICKNLKKKIEEEIKNEKDHVLFNDSGVFDYLRNGVHRNGRCSRKV